MPETVAVEKTMESMINLDGATLVFPTSFGYFDPHMLKVAAKYPEDPVPPLRRPVDRGQAPEEHRQLLRLHRRGAVPRRHRRRLDHQDAASWASSPPSRSRRCCATSTPSPWARSRSIRRSRRRSIFTGDWSLPVKEAEATNSDDRPGRRCRDLPRRLAQGRGRDGRARRHLHLRLSLQPGQARAQGLPDRRRVELGAGLRRLGRRDEGGQGARATSCAAASRKAMSAPRPTVRRCRRRPRRRPTRPRPRSSTAASSIYKGALKDNKGNTVIPAGTSYVITEPKLESMNYLVEGVVGSTS